MKAYKMKKILFLFAISALIYSGCSNSDDPVTPVDPPTGEVLMATVSFDSVSGSFSSGGLVTQVRNFGTGSLNFTDRDSTRISFTYKGFSNAADTVFYVSDTAGVKLYLLSDNSVSASTYKSVNVTVPSRKINAPFYYTIRARTTSGTPWMAIKDLKLYKK